MKLQNINLENNLKTFTNFAENHSNEIPYSLTLDFKKHKGHIVFSGLVHGNETGSLPAIIRIIQDLLSKKISYGGKISFFLGNIPAAQQNVRFIEMDLNRSFGESAATNTTIEAKRARELTPLLQQADVYYDFHQTIMPCLRPFYIFEMDFQSYYWARSTGIANTYVTRKKGAAFSNLGMCTDEYVRSLQKVGITIELGEKGFQKDAELYAYLIMKRAIKNMDLVYLHNCSIKKLAHKNEDFEFMQIKYKEKFDHPNKRLHQGFSNFKFIDKNDSIGFDGNNKPLIAPLSGNLLFPKYPPRDENNQAKSPLPGELYVIAQKMNFHPLKWLSAYKSRENPSRTPNSK
ncbi:succinylglutamate desuccinylase/aspartoacylase family protein [Pigmentibacter sp. JX0631]|uniref:succinylglutamate desuccinylase/aspartoacylase domain-containing protein n=1 Tax=Pigmentibacter sp. JX0631 TaxID=2976982 RepID=UPI002468B5B0|nr:succinylglutamate desuccinylase/aspartoacylase family protein [Pigmentibacter sp. JX0631]WGL59900.1 succinylglutamate desuccinylase/aspartoacylase family protein [Pigmentibacter sp. JX0631]